MGHNILTLWSYSEISTHTYHQFFRHDPSKSGLPNKTISCYSRVNIDPHFCWLGGFSFPLTLQSHPYWQACNTTTIHFGVAPAYYTIQAWNFSFLANLSWGTSQEATDSSWEERGNVVGAWTVGTHSIYFYNLFVPSAFTWVWSHTYHFRLMIECCCEGPILWLGRLDNI